MSVRSREEGLARCETYEPFEVPRSKALNGQRALDLPALRPRGFWAEVDDDKEGLSEARGCYVFAITAGRGITP